MHERQLGVAAAAHHRHHALALGEAPGARPERCHLSRELEAGDVGRRARRRRIGALALQHVGAVQAGGAHADQKLVLAGLRVRAVLDDKLSVLDGYGPHRRGIYWPVLSGCNAEPSHADIRVTVSP